MLPGSSLVHHAVSWNDDWTLSLSPVCCSISILWTLFSGSVKCFQERVNAVILGTVVTIAVLISRRLLNSLFPSTTDYVMCDQRTAASFSFKELDSCQMWPRASCSQCWSLANSVENLLRIQYSSNSSSIDVGLNCTCSQWIDVVIFTSGISAVLAEYTNVCWDTTNYAVVRTTLC